MEKVKKCLCLPVILICIVMLSACGSSQSIDDYATNEGYEQNTGVTGNGKGIAKENIKVGVLHISDPAEGSGYSYTHDIGIQGMQENLGLSDSQIVRKLNIDDGDAKAVEKALQECVDEGCNVIFTTSWGYMKPTADMAEKYPDVYFVRIYEFMYVSGIVAVLN